MLRCGFNVDDLSLNHTEHLFTPDEAQTSNAVWAKTCGRFVISHDEVPSENGSKSLGIHKHTNRTTKIFDMSATSTLKLYFRLLNITLVDIFLLPS